MRRWTPLILALALTACNSTDSVLDPSAVPQPAVTAGTAAGDGVDPARILPAANAEPAIVAPAAVAPATTLNAQAAALSSNARIQIAPIVGSTVEAVTPLTRQLSQRAASRGIALVSSGATETTHLLKGYFSAITEGSETTVIYVWDVLDPSGNRLHRIQGQEKTANGAAEGWSGVSSPTMEAIGEKTIDQLAAWLAARPG